MRGGSQAHDVLGQSDLPTSLVPASHGVDPPSLTPPPLPAAPPGDALAAPKPPTCWAHQARLRRNRLIACAHDAPSWLVSLVFHLTIFLVLGILTPPIQRTSAVHLLMVMSSPVPTQDLATASLSFAQPRQVERGEQAKQTAENEDAAESAPDSQELVQAELPNIAADVTEKLETLKSLMQEFKGAAQRAAQQHSAELVSARASSTDEAAGSTASAARPRPEELPDGRDPQRWNELYRSVSADDVVQRFIMYDIGQLQGEAGARARADFNALGPEAIPALVRGLNRSAYIRASCPVGVISSKLSRSLDQTRDPLLIRYALENIGRGVPDNQPHAQRITSFRNQLVKRLGYREQISRATLAKHGLAVSQQDVKLLSQMADMTIQQLQNALQSDDPQQQLLALVELSTRKHERLSAPKRLELARQVMKAHQADQLERQREAQRVLQILAESSGLSYGAAGQSIPGRTAQWQRYWNTFEIEHMVRPRTRALLRMAEMLENRGRHQQAITRYRELVTRYPMTPEAEVASERLQWLSP